MNTQKSKKQLEILIMEYFRRNYPDFPKGKLKASESPDFIHSISARSQVGIELTRLCAERINMADSYGFDSYLRKKEMVAGACRMFEKSASLKLFVKVVFHSEIHVLPAKNLSLSVLCFNAVREAVKNKKPGSFFRIFIAGDKLPEEIRGILVVTHPVLETSVWEIADELENQDEIAGKIIQLVTKKNEKLQLYRKKWLNQYWLLITTDGLARFNEDQVALINKREHFSGFHKVFLFDLVRAGIFQIF